MEEGAEESEAAPAGRELAAAAASKRFRGCPPADGSQKHTRSVLALNLVWTSSDHSLGAGVAARGALFPEAGEGVPGGFPVEG